MRRPLQKRGGSRPSGEISWHYEKPVRASWLRARRRWLVSCNDEPRDRTASQSTPSSEPPQEQSAQEESRGQERGASAQRSTAGARGIVATIEHRSRLFLHRTWALLSELFVLRGPMLRRYFTEYAWFMLTIGLRLLVLILVALLSPIIYAFVRLLPRWKKQSLWTEPSWPRRICFIGGANAPLLRQIAAEVCSGALPARKTNTVDVYGSSPAIQICWVDTRLDALEDARASCTALTDKVHFRLLHLVDLDLQSPAIRQSVLALREELGAFDMVVIAAALESQADSLLTKDSMSSARVIQSPSSNHGSRFDIIRMTTDISYRRIILAGSVASELIGEHGHVVYVTGTTRRIGYPLHPWVWLENAWRAVRRHALSERRVERPMHKHISSITVPAAYAIEPDSILTECMMAWSSTESTRSSAAASLSKTCSVASTSGTPSARVFASPTRDSLSNFARCAVSRILLGEPEVVIPFPSALLLLLDETIPVLVLEIVRATAQKMNGAADAGMTNR